MGCGGFLEQASSLPAASAPFRCPPIPNNAPPHATFPTGGTLVWQDNTAVNYSNWGPPGLGPSMLSHNSCYWIQSSSGLWRPGACTNISMGVVCKLPRGAGDIGAGGRGGPGRCSFCRPHSGWEGVNRPGVTGTLLWDQLVCTKDWPFLKIARVDSHW